MVVGICTSPFGKDTDTIVDVRRDTVMVRDTIRELHPVEVAKVRKETIRVEVRDTVWNNDTLYMSLPMETKTYKGEDYRAEVSGYRPSLDLIEVYPQTVYITTTQTMKHRNRISLGMELGYSSIAQIPIYLEYGRLVHKNLEVYGKVYYDFPRFNPGVSVGVRTMFEWGK